MRRKLVYLLPFILLILMGCSQKPPVANNSEFVVEKSWQEIESLAKGTEVRMFMWGGDQNVNRYMDDWVAPRLKEKYGLNFVRVPMDAPDFMQKLTTEKKANVTEGSMDIIWINGENFKNAKDAKLLSQPFVSKLPNYQSFVDQKSPNVTYDFGTPVEGLEAPWGKVQFVFLYDSAKIPTPPKNFQELATWAKNNPGKFTYPDPADFTGNAFLRHLLYEMVGAENLLKKEQSPKKALANAKDMWNYLIDLKPYLWKKGQTYPQALSQLDQLYSQGEVWFTMGYNEARAEALIKQGVFPKTTKSLILETGSIGNTHFLAIPYNSPNMAGAMVAINYLLSPEAQLAKLDPSGWGDNTVLDINKLPQSNKKQLLEIERGASVLAPETLQKALLPEVSPDYVNLVKEKWFSEVAKPAN